MVGAARQNAAGGSYVPQTSRNASHTSPTVARAAQRLLHRVQHVVAARGRGPQCAERRVTAFADRAARSVASRADLLRLDRRIDAQRLVRLLLVECEPVDADHGPLPRSRSPARSGTPTLDLALLESGLDRVDRRRNPRSAPSGRSRHPRSRRSSPRRRTSRRTDRQCAVRSVSYARTCWVRSARRAAFSVGSAIASSKEFVCSDWVPPSTAAEPLDRDPDQVDLGLLGGQLHARGLGVEAQHPRLAAPWPRTRRA